MFLVVEFVSMSLIQQIQTDLVQALKAKDAARLGTLRLIVSQVKYKEIAVQHTLTDEETIAVVRKQVKELEEAATMYKSAGREDLYAENVAQIAVMREYLPPEMSDGDLEVLMREYLQAHRSEHDANPRAFTGKLVQALRSKAQADRIVKMYQKIQE